MIFKIKLNTIDDVKDLVQITSRANGDVDLICGKYYIDAKSIMGVLSLPLNDTLSIKIEDNDVSQLKSELEKFIVKSKGE